MLFEMFCKHLVMSVLLGAGKWLFGLWCLWYTLDLK
jgi:hypothetical protein